MNVRDVIAAVGSIVADSWSCDWTTAQRVLSYLLHFGHLDPVTLLAAAASTRSAEHIQRLLETSVISAGRWAGIDLDGSLSPQIELLAALPRCGRPEPVTLGAASYRWQKALAGQPVTWAVQSYLDGIPRSVQDDVLAECFASWGKVTAKLRHQRVGDWRSADVYVYATRLDGRGSVLAEAQLPPGDDRQVWIRFDAGDLWKAAKPASGIEILYPHVARHEIGHHVGLEHDAIPRQLMNPIYSTDIGTLQDNDTRRVQAIYGVTTEQPQEPAKGRVVLEFDGAASNFRVVNA